jgi:hypothetical protein
VNYFKICSQIRIFFTNRAKKRNLLAMMKQICFLFENFIHLQNGNEITHFFVKQSGSQKYGVLQCGDWIGEFVAT